MATPKGTNGPLLKVQYAELWDAFVKERDRKQDWRNWLWGTHINKSKVSAKLGFSVDVFDDNPDVNSKEVEQRLIQQGVINPDAKINAKSKIKEKTKLSRVDAARLKTLEETNNLLRVNLQNLMAVLMKKQHEITVINFTVPEHKRLELNVLVEATNLDTTFDCHVSDHTRLKEAELVNIRLRELKFVCQMWVDRLDVAQDVLSKSLRVPVWL